MVWSGLGVNYKSSQANWASDIAYFQSIGLTTIRPHLSNFPVGTYTPGSEIAIEGSIDWWRNCAKTFLDAGFIVVHGPASSPTAPFTSTVWTDYRAKVLQDAAYCQAQGMALDVYLIGNEIEGDIDNTTLTQTQLIANLKALATDVKAVYPLAKKIGYSTYDPGGTMFNLWVSAGLGDIDILYANVYAQTAASGESFIFGDMAKLGLMIKTFGADRFALSEFGITGSSSEYTASSSSNRNRVMRHIYAGIRELGFTQAIAYSYVGYLDEDNDFALKNTDGTFDVQWGVLLADGGANPLATVGGVTSPVSELTTPAPEGTPVTVATTPVVYDEHPVYYKAGGNLGDFRVQCVTRTHLQLGLSDDFTVVVKGRFKPKTATGNASRHTIARMDFNFGGVKGYLVQLNASDGQIWWWSGNTSYQSAAGVVPFNTDVKIAVRITGTTVTAYVDDVLVWTQTVARVGNDTGVNCWYLSEGGSQNGAFGAIYEIMSVKSHLTTTEMADIDAGTYPTLDVRYNFTRGAGRWTADLSGNNNHGLLGVESWGFRAGRMI